MINIYNLKKIENFDRLHNETVLFFLSPSYEKEYKKIDFHVNEFSYIVKNVNKINKTIDLYGVKYRDTLTNKTEQYMLNGYWRILKTDNKKLNKIINYKFLNEKK